jgi:hypothetical protein
MNYTEKQIEDAFKFYLKKHNIVVKDDKQMKSELNIWKCIQTTKMLRDKKDYALEL